MQRSTEEESGRRSEYDSRPQSSARRSEYGSRAFQQLEQKQLS